MKIHSIILARGGSKGIPKKNIMDFCGKPLIAWTITQCQKSDHVSDVWVSSDNDEILGVAKDFGAKIIKRPGEFSHDEATSESAWLHSIDHLTTKGVQVDAVLAPQVTSPLRETSDIDSAISKFIEEGCDSMFSASMADDLFFWEEGNNELIHSVNYDYKNRQRRQDSRRQIIENGSFYLFKPEVIQKESNRFGGKIGYSKMEFWKMFEIDDLDDAKMCSALMQEFLLKDIETQR